MNWRIGLPVLVTAVVLSPVGARLTPLVDRRVLLAPFAAFLVVAGLLMLFYRTGARERPLGRATESAAGAGVGSAAGFLGGLLGVGGGNFILPVLTWFRSGRAAQRSSPLRWVHARSSSFTASGLRTLPHHSALQTK